MIKTYFFVPLTSERFIENAQQLNVDAIVYDLEDAISNNSKDQAFQNIKLISKLESSIIRPKIDWNSIQFEEIKYLCHQGFTKFLIPKAESFENLKLIIDYLSDLTDNFQILLLVENPRLLFELPEIIRKYSAYITGLSLGSHDYCNFMGAKHEYKSYQFAHNYILNLGKSFNIEAIDIASMHINEKESFVADVKAGFDKGFRSKFILHPKQLEYLKEIDYFSEEEIAFAKLVESTINLDDDFDAIKVGGKILEKPHINRIKEIIKYIHHGAK